MLGFFVLREEFSKSTEMWPRGLRRHPAKMELGVNLSRGFESLRLRQNVWGVKPARCAARWMKWRGLEVGSAVAEQDNGDVAERLKAPSC